ncbi:MAG TPA: hypothetical protein PLJ27_20570 [Polyangiaceae bacterium]|nr:hypothetical protein [Polyangiaceae bacterium]HOD21433.1 hypothetical protein [Polyangiaceae bacterium]HOG98730.1 hypothetical protein [Polyangiaceae bacterium]HOT10865.1 hypothetical protein [Polyangiaceae bacterium]HPB95406.1 hypothetical protein [Polyangiaceae bacterium]
MPLPASTNTSSVLSSVPHESVPQAVALPTISHVILPLTRILDRTASLVLFMENAIKIACH